MVIENNAKVNSDNKANSLINISNVDSYETLTVSKKVTIFRKEGASAYYQRNAKFIPEGKYKIGSAINSVNRMRVNLEEIDVYMPRLLSINKNDNKYSESVDLWFNNISTNVQEVGLTLEVGFTYFSANDRKTVEELEDSIYKKFNAANKNNPRDRDAAIDLRDKEIVSLESTKYKHGSPINLNNYILWRYCLVYSDVANDIALINKSGGIRFYMYDANREKHKEKLLFDIRNKATTIYVKLLDMPDKVNNMLWAEKGVMVNVDKLEAIDKFTMIENLAKADPANFIKLYSDVNIDIKASLERMIHYNILKRLPSTSVIVDENNDVIGNTMDEAIIFFKNEEHNKAAITRFRSKLKDYSHG